MTKHIETCCTCGKPFTAQRSNQTHCATPCLARTCKNAGCNLNPARPDHAGDFIKNAPASLVEQRKAQMEELYKAYDDRPPIIIDRLPEGTRVVSLSDLQIPFEEQWLIGGTTGKEGAVEAFLKDYKPDYLIYNGDILDAYSISTFAKSPARRWTLRDEGNKCRRMLEAHKKLVSGKGDIIFIDGNHEQRMARTLMEAAYKDRSLWEILDSADFLTFSSRELLKLDELGIKWLNYPNYAELLGFIFTHGNIVAAGSGATAMKMLTKWHSSGVSGHTHRAAAVNLTGAAGDTHVWYEQGCLCRLDPDYSPGADWQQAFLIGEVHNKRLHTQLVNIFDYRFVVNGKEYKARGS